MQSRAHIRVVVRAEFSEAVLAERTEAQAPPPGVLARMPVYFMGWWPLWGGG